MSTTERWLAPRRLFLGGGLLLIALGAWRDQDLLSLARLPATLEWSGAGPELPPEGLPEERLTRVLRAHEVASGVHADGLETTRHVWAPDTPAGEAGPVDLEKLRAEREKLWPGRSRQLEETLAAVLALGREEPGNGLFEVLAGGFELELALFPGPGELGLADLEDRELAPALRVVDPDRVDRALSRIDRGLAAPTFDLHKLEAMRARAACGSPAPLAGLFDRVEGLTMVEMPELMLLRHTVAYPLTLLARREADPIRAGRLLGRARRIGLRLGAQSTTLIELLVATACIAQADQAWLEVAARHGEAELAAAATEELGSLRESRHVARLQGGGDDPSTWGILDAHLIPPGARRDGEWLGRTLDHAVLESLAMWTLVAGALAALPFGLWQARRPGAPAGASWTLGDLLGVVLGSFGAVAATWLCYRRLNPLGTASVVPFEHGVAWMVQTALLLSAAPFLFRWLLRRAALQKHGLGWTRPALARGSLFLVLGGASLALFWVGGRELSLAPLAGALALLGWAASFPAGVWTRPAGERAAGLSLQRAEGRVGLAALGATLALLGAIELGLVAPRRDRLVERATLHYTQALEEEARRWGEGEPRKALIELLARHADRPRPSR